MKALLWPESRLSEAVLALAHASGMPIRSGSLPPLPEGTRTVVELLPWLNAASRSLDLELQSVQLRMEGIEDFLRGAAPAILALPGGYGALLPGNRLLGPDLRVKSCSVAELKALLLQPSLAAVARGYPDLMDSLGPEFGPVVQRVWMRDMELFPGFLLRLPADAPALAQARSLGLHRLLGGLLGLQVAMTLLGVAGAWLGASRAIEGRMSGGDVLLWLLLSFSILPLMAVAVWLRGELGLRLGLLFRRRLLAGILKLEPDEVRSEGVGGHLGRLMDAAEVESLALGAGLGALTAGVDLGIAAGVLYAGPLGAPGSLLLMLLSAGIGVGAGLLWRRQQAWTRARLGLTGSMIERMVGHRTRLAFLKPERWFLEEDAELEDYGRRSADRDRWAAGLGALGAGLWPVIGLLFLLPVVWMGLEPEAMALGLGGLLLAGGALGGLVGGLDRLLSAAVAWERVAPLWRAVDRRALPGEVETGLALARDQAVVGQRVLDAQGLSFHFPGRQNLLTGVGLELRSGDRVLVEGPSGGGKSTLASLLAALRRPQEGILLLRGYDLPSVGERSWRRMVATAPQFHENHIFSQSLAFNLLMGAGWPATPQQQAEAAQLCEELGLGPLLQRMPAGLRQQVGETGWQLSHGERSRVYLARALLQGAEVVILDESFGALDPETQVQALRTARRVAKTLVVIAHP